MKDATLRVLITARALLEQAERLCISGDRYLATAGIIVLQDAVELILLAVLIEREVDEQKSLENLTFDQMIGEIRGLNLPIKKSGTLKAMNKLRVTAKHYGQIMEPITVQGHLNVAKASMDSLLHDVLGKSLRDIYLTELIAAHEPRQFLEGAVRLLEDARYIDALIEIRKAFFVEFERDYCIYGYRDRSANEARNAGLGMLGVLRGGWKAHYWKQNKEWIEQNIKMPCDYIQVDEDRLRLDAIEWGINTQAIANLRRLTPQVVRFEYGAKWHFQYDATFQENSATKENASYCLDLAIDAVRKKHAHQKGMRFPGTESTSAYPPMYVGQHLYESPNSVGRVLKTLDEDDRYVVKSILSGFDADATFYHIECTTSSGSIIRGFVQQLSQPLETLDSSAESGS